MLLQGSQFIYVRTVTMLMIRLLMSVTKYQLCWVSQFGSLMLHLGLNWNWKKAKVQDELFVFVICYSFTLYSKSAFWSDLSLCHAYGRLFVNLLFVHLFTYIGFCVFLHWHRWSPGIQNICLNRLLTAKMSVETLYFYKCYLSKEPNLTCILCKK